MIRERQLLMRLRPSDHGSECVLLTVMTRAIALFVACALLLVAACSDDGGSDTPANTNEPTSAGQPTGEPAGEGITATLGITSGTAAVGATAALELSAGGLAEPGLGAWTIDIEYDQDVLSVSACEVSEAALAVCNKEAEVEEGNPDAGTKVRLAGATAEGLIGDLSLATVTFTCDAAGTADITLVADTLADATIGGPRNIDETVTNGTVTCT
jgi:hypothetical protein